MATLKIAFLAWNAEATDTYLRSLAIDNADQVKRYDRRRGRVTLKDGTKIYGVHGNTQLDGLYFDQIIVADDYRLRTLYACRNIMTLPDRLCFSCVPEEYQYQIYDIDKEPLCNGNV